MKLCFETLSKTPAGVIAVFMERSLQKAVLGTQYSRPPVLDRSLLAVLAAAIEVNFG